MASRFDMYVRRSTWLHRMDPRVKLAYVVAVIVATLLTNNLLWMLGYFLLSCLFIALTRVTWETLSKAIIYRLLLPITIMIILLYPITSPYTNGPVLWEFWIIRVTLPNVIQGITMAVRIDTMTFASYVLILTTTQRDLVRAIVRLGMPYKVGFLMSSALRYLPAFEDVINKTVDAQKARALDLTKGGLMAKVRNYIPLLIAAMVTSLRLADQLAIALVSRGFGASGKRTYLKDLKMRATDVVALVVTVVLFGALLIARFLLGVGA